MYKSDHQNSSQWHKSLAAYSVCVMATIKISSSTGSFEKQLKCVDYDSCDCKQCQSKSLIQRYRNALKILEYLTKDETMATQDDPLKDAFELSKEIKNLKGAHLKKDLRRYATKCKIFTEGLCNECVDDNEIAALYNFDVKYLKEFEHPMESAKMVKMLNEAINAHHTKVLIKNSLRA